MKSTKSGGRSRFCALIIGVAAIMLLPGVAAAAGPGDLIKGLIQEVLGILNDPGLQGTSHRSQRVARVEQVAARYIDYREMARRCLGDTWGKLSPKQQDEFVQLFSQHLKSSHASRLDEFAKAEVTYQPETLKGESCEVPMLIKRPNDKLPVTFRLLNENQGWKIVDINVEGVSLVDNYRSQFGRVIRGSSFQNLVNCLKLDMQRLCQPGSP